MLRISFLLVPLLAVVLGGCMQLVPSRITDVQWTVLKAGEAPPLPGSAGNDPPRELLFVHLRTRWNLAVLWRLRAMTAVAKICLCDFGRSNIRELVSNLVRREDTLLRKARPSAWRIGTASL
ncbi:hypothetical protein [Siccirubricoccus deserti]|uniref:Uncharacterized protein n=1 Tax=Siccirubricoccus deserti TaxID=2013562 RepID=A0A9X0UF43_9PROT|nr:hypothetical protein [Siccirubricoccus deserti]MBC4014035.1 hypothetical protein [Siccirubricoccus deserti]